MRSSLTSLLFAAILLTQLPGCGGGAPAPGSVKSVEETNKPKSNAELKAKLEEIAKSGEGGSATAGLRPGIEQLESKEVAAELLKELDKLQVATTKDEIKAIATRMISKL